MALYVDYINVMTYEFHNFAQQNYTGFNSPLFGRKDDYPNETTSNIKDAVQYYVDNGMRKDQIIVGFPTFGRGWTLLSENDTGVHAPCIGKSNGTRYFGWGGGATYADICDMLSKGARRVFDNEAKVPYLVLGKQWFSYDDEESYQIKVYLFLHINSIGFSSIG
uniref:GH18 domain-containing protein n=2 Tax=Acrobeloides nanus TaxID=290746 RepID=A0A914EBC0_9BILA